MSAENREKYQMFVAEFKYPVTAPNECWKSERADRHALDAAFFFFFSFRDILLSKYQWKTCPFLSTSSFRSFLSEVSYTIIQLLPFPSLWKVQTAETD